MTRRSCIAMIILLAACASPARTPIASRTPPPPPTSPCGGQEYVGVTVPPAPALDCENGSCTVTVPVSIHNCYAETIYVIELAGDKLRQPVAPNATWITERTLGQFELQIGMMVTLETYRYENWGEVTCTSGRTPRCTNRPFKKRTVMFQMQSVPINAVNYKLIAAKEACVACDGVWGQNTMLGDESCACRTRDKGRVCVDGADCEGFCELVRFVVVKKRKGVELGFAEGRCSEFVDRFSCTSAIPVGAREAGIGPENITTECVD